MILYFPIYDFIFIFYIGYVNNALSFVKKTINLSFCISTQLRITFPHKNVYKKTEAQKASVKIYF